MFTVSVSTGLSDPMAPTELLREGFVSPTWGAAAGLGSAGPAGALGWRGSGRLLLIKLLLHLGLPHVLTGLPQEHDVVQNFQGY